jgi:hypothetical protein
VGDPSFIQYTQPYPGIPQSSTKIPIV